MCVGKTKDEDGNIGFVQLGDQGEAADKLATDIKQFGPVFGQFLIMLYANRFFVQFNESVCRFTYDENDMIENIECFNTATFKQMYQERFVPDHDFEDLYWLKKKWNRMFQIIALSATTLITLTHL